MRQLRIHGDNIVECERTLSLLSQALGITPILQPNSPLYLPIYNFDTEFQVELLSGYNRWGIDIAAKLMENGGILRECADAYLTEVHGNKEHILLALEYCSALPAGNNAWQRNGRAYSSVMAGVPYLYFAEIGGVELDTDRSAKAPRYPNPVVPFSYIATSQRQTAFCLPVYQPHTTITNELFDLYRTCFGNKESLKIVHGIIMGTDYIAAKQDLSKKTLSLVILLANERHGSTTLKNDEWDKWLNSPVPDQWLSKNVSHLIWKSKKSRKVETSNTFQTFCKEMAVMGSVVVGSKDLPFCLIPSNRISDFEKLLTKIYPQIQFPFNPHRALTVVWVTGFKPRGDDSRPDRGLTPLVRMLAGENTDILAVVSGPAKQFTWDTFKTSPKQLGEDNGLWQAILNLCDYVLVDSKTCKEPLFHATAKKRQENRNVIVIPYCSGVTDYSEQDTDTAIHQIFAHKETNGIYECMCNPPGGDWSGINVNDKNGNVFRWTSLPRVSPNQGKRPDHVIQFSGNTLLAIESKCAGGDLEDNIGNNLKTYINDLFRYPPTAYKTPKTDWRLCTYDTRQTKNYTVLSAGAFILSESENLPLLLQRCQLDIIFAFEFGETTTLHLLSNTNGKSILGIAEQIARQMQGVEIQIH